MTSTIAVIGAGNMARSIIGGLLARGHDPARLLVANIRADSREQISNDFGVRVSTSNAEAAALSDVLLLAVKPDVVQPVCREIATGLPASSLVISVAAGIRSTDIDRWLGGNRPIVRCMPNTPALLNLGASAIYCNPSCSPEQQRLATGIIESVGICRIVANEADIDTVTALSGSGPAYFFHLIECMTDAAVAMGLDADTAASLAIETAYGAASMARSRSQTPARLRENVTSKGGTTAAALASFAENDFPDIVHRAMLAAGKRATELGEQYGQD